VAKREAFLAAAGLRPYAVRALAAETLALIASRKVQASSTIVAMIVAGFDIDEIYLLEQVHRWQRLRA